MERSLTFALIFRRVKKRWRYSALFCVYHLFCCHFQIEAATWIQRSCYKTVPKHKKAFGVSGGRWKNGATDFWYFFFWDRLLILFVAYKTCKVKWNCSVYDVTKPHFMRITGQGVDLHGVQNTFNRYQAHHNQFLPKRSSLDITMFILRSTIFVSIIFFTSSAFLSDEVNQFQFMRADDGSPDYFFEWILFRWKM